MYITHAHGDHLLGLKLLFDRFPKTRAFATASTVAAMRDQIKPDSVQSFWVLPFPGQVPSEFVLPEVLGPDNSARHIEETRRYIRDLITIVATTAMAPDQYEKMLGLHPSRVNPGSLWATAKA